jgi:hypothetical protein
VSRIEEDERKEDTIEMITVNSVLGNINNDKKLKEKYDEMNEKSL